MVIVGAQSSGTDIARELSAVADVHCVSRKCAATSLPPQGSDTTVTTRPEIQQLRPDGSVVFVDGSVVENVDHLLLCTGYVVRAVRHTRRHTLLGHGRRQTCGMLFC